MFLGFLVVLATSKLFANPDPLLYPKKRTLKAGPYFGLQSGRFYALEYGWELQRKTREDRVKRLDTAVKRMATQPYSPAEVRQEKAELAAAKEKAATARRAHIDSKNEVKAATKRFRSGQETGGDNRRFGRDTERSKATDAQLKTALGDKRVSPTAKAAIERELSTRQARAKTEASKAASDSIS